MPRIRVGVIGAGMVAQMMHLPYLRELSDLFDIAAVCDVSRKTAEAVAADYGVQRVFTRYEDLLESPLDAVLVLTPGFQHAESVVGAASAGKHVFVEKPLTFTLEAADAMIAAVRRAGVVGQVGYMKRFDAGFLLGKAALERLRDVRWINCQCLHPRSELYAQHYQFHRFEDVPEEVQRQGTKLRQELIRQAVGEVSPELRKAYAESMLDSMVHDVNALRGLYGEPERLLDGQVWAGGECVSAVFGYAGGVRASVTWAMLPELRDYRQDFNFYASAGRVSVQFPSPYLKNAPTPVVVSAIEDGIPWEKRGVVDYEEPFKLELIDFHRCITEGGVPRNTLEDARRDVDWLQRIHKLHQERYS